MHHQVTNAGGIFWRAGHERADYKKHDGLKWQHRSEAEVALELAAHIRGRRDQGCCAWGRVLFMSLPMYLASGAVVWVGVEHFGIQVILPLSIPHHETFSTTIQPPYRSTKGWIIYTHQVIFPLLIALTTLGTVTGPARTFPTKKDGRDAKLCGCCDAAPMGWPFGHGKQRRPRALAVLKANPKPTTKRYCLRLRRLPSNQFQNPPQ